jgi:hypothetical protein
MPDESNRVPMDVGDAVLCDAVGAQAVRFEAMDEVGLILDLEGRLNKLQVRVAHRYALRAGQAAELIAELVVASQVAAGKGSELAITGGQDFLAELDAAIANEQRRRGLTDA